MARFGVSTSQVITRPANTTQYAAGDLVANSATAGSVTEFVLGGRVMQGRNSGRVTGGALIKSANTTTAAGFRLHLFNQAKTLTNGDNGAVAFNSLAGYIGAIDFDAATAGNQRSIAGSTGYVTRAAAADLKFGSLGGDKRIYGYLENTHATGYTPASGETFQVSIDIEV